MLTYTYYCCYQLEAINIVVNTPGVDQANSVDCEKGILCGGMFSSNLGFRIYESNLFFWHNTAYHLIVCGAELKQQTLNEITRELEAKKAQLQNCCFQHICLAWKKK